MLNIRSLSAAVVVFSLALPAAALAQGRGRGPTSHPTPPTTPGATHGNPHDSGDAGKTHGRSNSAAQGLEGTKLGDKLQGLLPSGMSLSDAASGFKNRGQFVAAVHVAHNLDIPFADLKATMLGTAPNTKPMSLGDAIHKLKPSANADKEASEAENEAKEDLKTKG